MADTKIKDTTNKAVVASTDQIPINDVVGGNLDKMITVDGIKTFVKTGMVSSDVGLGNVDNTSDVNKPVSSATQTAFNLKSNLASPTFTGTVVLPNIPSVVQTALDLKQAIVSGVDDTEIGYLNGVTSNIQAQIDTKSVIKETEIDFGTAAYQTEKEFTITDGLVTTGSQIISTVALKSPSDSRSTDEILVEDFNFMSTAGSGSFNLLARSLHGSISGKYVVNYVVG